jgi:hypothetical protein
MERTRSFAPFAKVREAILDIRAQGNSTAHQGSSLSASPSIGKCFSAPKPERVGASAYRRK